MKRRFLTLLPVVLILAQLTACRGSAPAAAAEVPETVCIPETEEAQAADPQVSVQWAGDGLDYDTFTADTSQPQSRVLLTAGSPVKNVKVLALTLEEVDEAGAMTFSTRELYTQEVLTPERPLVVVLCFYGTVPYYGISYVDSTGSTRSFALEISGEDGSPLLREFKS